MSSGRMPVDRTATGVYLSALLKAAFNRPRVNPFVYASEGARLNDPHLVTRRALQAA